MRIPVVLSIAVAASALIACKGKVSNQTGPGSGTTSAAAGSAGSATMGALIPNKGSAAPDIVLPHSDGSPPVKSAGPISLDKISELSQMQFPGFLRDVRKADSYLEVRHKTESRPRIMATVNVDSCANSPCMPMDVEKWKAKTDDLKGFLAPALKTDSNTDFEVGATTLDGQPAIYTFQLAQAIDKGSDGNMAGAYSYAYVLYWNDGINQIRVVSEYKDDPMKTKQDMVKSVPRADLEKVATAFADIYTHKW